MTAYIARRTLLTIPNLILISIVAFTIIQLPPGDWATTYVAGLLSQGQTVTEAEVTELRERFGLDEPIPIQYLKWMSGVIVGDFGRSFDWGARVSDVIWARLELTFLISLSTLLLSWIIAFPIGIYSAVRQYSLFDYVFTTIGFIGIAIPNFLFALVMLYVGLEVFGANWTGLYSLEYADAAWSVEKVQDMLSRIWLPLLILGSSGTAALIRIMRANLLDELKKPYVITAYAKGQSRWRTIFKYPVRVALNPFISTVGWALPTLVSGTIIVAIVLNLPTSGPVLLDALLNQDMYLASSFILILSVLTVLGTLISDILLAWLDPRIRFE